MKAAVIVFPGSNCDRDLAVGLKRATGKEPVRVWHKDTQLPDNLDFIGIPGGFSFGDYLRCGAIAARSPIMSAVKDYADKGGIVFGVCNGFQVLLEAGLLPGSLIRNANLRYICRDVKLTVETDATPFTAAYAQGEIITIPVAHHDGNYIADETLVARLKDENRVAFRYLDNPNGSVDNIAGVLSANRRVLGMMPHPERLNQVALGGTDGARLFESAVSFLQPA